MICSKVDWYKPYNSFALVTSKNAHLELYCFFETQLTCSSLIVNFPKSLYNRLLFRFSWKLFFCWNLFMAWLTYVVRDTHSKVPPPSPVTINEYCPLTVVFPVFTLARPTMTIISCLNKGANAGLATLPPSSYLRWSIGRVGFHCRHIEWWPTPSHFRLAALLDANAGWRFGHILLLDVRFRMRLTFSCNYFMLSASMK